VSQDFAHDYNLVQNQQNQLEVSSTLFEEMDLFHQGGSPSYNFRFKMG
jgi:hypothetical protein